MMMRGWRRAAAMGSLGWLGCGWMAAQTPQVMAPPLPPQASGPTGTVTGRVVYGDTQMPARFAEAEVIPVDAFNGSSGSDRSHQRFTARTDLDGVFTASGVPVGDYYVTGTAAGYVSEDTVLRQSSGDALQNLLAGLPVVHVAVGGSNTANVSLERGAVIAGKLLWDDGSPAAGVQISAMVKQASTTTGTGNGAGLGGFGGGFGAGFAIADDRGQFRLNGLSAGDYLLRATVQAPMPSTSAFARNTSLVVYAPGKMRKTEAATITVHAGEERDDVAFTLDLKALHTVSGQVGAVSGPAVQSGTVRLTDSVDTTLTRSGTIAGDGSFVMKYVPAGTYTLTVAGSTAAASNGRYARGGSGSTSGGSFQPFSETITVGDSDVTGVGVQLTPVGSS